MTGGSTERRALRGAAAGVPVNCHFHWFPRAFFEALCERTRSPRAERDGDGYTYWFDGGRRRDSIPADFFDLDALLAGQDAVDPGTTVISTLSTHALLDELTGAEGLEFAALFNEQMAAAQRLHPGRFWGAAAVPLADPEGAVSALEHAVGELGLRGVNLPGSIDGAGVDAPGLEPFYARVEALGVPLFLHPTDLALSGAWGADYVSTPLVAFHAADAAGLGGAIHLGIGRLVDSSVAALRLVFGGVMERHTNLKVLHFHCGGILPYVAGRLDKNARVPGMQEPASTYLKRMYTDTVAPQWLTVRLAVDFYGADRVLYGDDYPCWNPVAARAGVAELELSDDELSGVLSGNARRLLGLDTVANPGLVLPT